MWVESGDIPTMLSLIYSGFIVTVKINSHEHSKPVPGSEFVEFLWYCSIC